jgi:predicted AlkP superfamily phosphohydrolase/phosphomutase
MERKVCVIGFDGATFDLIEPFMKRGLLPHFQKLLAEGASASLISVIPPVSAPAWVSLVTGKNPGIHNIYGFTDGKGRIVNSTFRRSKALWNLLDEHGKRSILINVPMTSPPEDINGIVISGILSPHEKGFSGRFDIDKESIMEKENTLAKMFQWEITKTERALHMLKNEEWDLFFIVYHLSDFVPTLYWKYMDTKHPQYTPDDTLSRAVEDAYKVLDDILGIFLSALDGNIHVVVVSDHGMGPSTRVFNINEWLRQEGFLHMKAAVMEKTLSPEKIAALIEQHGLIKNMVRIIPESFQKKAYKLIFSRSKNVFSRIEKTSSAYAYSHAHFASIWLMNKNNENGNSSNNKKKKEKQDKENEDILSLIEEKIKKFKDPKTGEKVITHVYRRDHIFHGASIDNAPDLVVEAVPHYSIRSQRLGTLFSEPLQSGDHRMNGIFIAHGPHIRKGTLGKISIFEVCPTLLAILGLPVPSDIDGDIKEIFEEGFQVEKEENPESQRHVQQQLYTEEEETTIKDRLSALGYFD